MTDTRTRSLTEDWFVVFTRSEYKKGVMRWIKRDFSHVYAMQKSPGGQFWVVVNPLLSHVDVELVVVDDYPHPRTWAGPAAVILPVRAKIKGDAVRWSVCVFNCVEVIKGLLGIKSFWTWTPWQLYKHINS